MAGLFIKLDTNFWSHPKVIAAGEQAAVLYQQMAMYCMDHATDGLVPDGQLPRFGLPRLRQRLDRLAATGLAEQVDGGWVLPGYVERYKTAAEVADLREKRRKAGQQGGRPRKQPEEPPCLDAEKANGNQVAFTAPNPEEEEEEEEEGQSSSDTSAARPPATDDDDLADELFHLAGIARPGPTAGQRKQLDAGLRRGWKPDQLRPKFAKAQGTGNPRGYVDAVLVSITNEDPPAFVVASAVGTLGEIGTRPLLGERQPCTNPDCVDGMVGGLGPDGRPEPVHPCPDCHVLGATA